jgi:methylated-DNA-[protein]-cysteine S-methyltransferase
MAPTGVRFHLWGRPLDQLLEWAEVTANHVPVTANHVPHGWTGHGKQSPVAAVEAYFAGAPVDLAQWPVVLEGVTEFTRRVYQAARRVKRGQTATYAQIAAAAGRPNAARAVGSAMARNPLPLFVPCHRIVSRAGMGGWSGPPGLKGKLLALEGAE